MNNAAAETNAEKIGWSREEMAQRTAMDIPNGAYVNLGIGIPELVARFVPEGREVIYHTENGLLGMGPVGDDGGEPELINAGKKMCLRDPRRRVLPPCRQFLYDPRRHLDICVLGAMQVAANGDLANWSTGAQGRHSRRRRCHGPGSRSAHHLRHHAARHQDRGDPKLLQRLHLCL
jgi:3-oxoadipate CoA-transferase beta subunit